MASQQEQEIQHVPQQQQQQQQLLLHLNSNIYNNGLKFERDRAFRNRLITKAILIMALLLIIVAVLCATAVKSSTNTITHNQTKVVSYIKKAITYDDDLEGNEKDREVLQDLKTTYIPEVSSYLNVQRNQNKVRSKRENVIENIYEPGNSTTNDSMAESKSGEILQEMQSQYDSKTEATRDTRKTEEEKSEKIKTFNDRYEDISMFWKKEVDKEIIRAIQAEKMLSYMDPTVDPCEDFYQYACGNWEKKNPIPEDKAGFDTFEMLRESLDSILRDLLLEPVENDTSDAVRKAKDLFESCMNEDWIQERGNEPLYVLSRSLKGWPLITPEWNATDFDWVDLMARLRLYNNDILLAQWVGPDIKNSADYIIQFDQTSLGLPTRDYYLQPFNAVYLDAYRNYMIQIAVLLGVNRKNATTEANDVIDFETRLAEITTSEEDRRNISELYVKMSLAKLSNVVPEIDWLRYLTIVLARKVDQEENVVVFALKYFKDLVKLIKTSSHRTVANYLMWRFMRHRVNYLGKEFQDAKQDFYLVLYGRKKAPPRWTSCVSHVNSNMGMALGSMFVQRYFDESSKNDTVSMTRDIMHSFKNILNTTEWIGGKTKLLALNKVNAMTLRIGYPDFILDEDELNQRYNNVNISKKLYFENSLNLISHLARVELDRLNTKVNKTMWNTPPAVVNAYYSRNKNQIMFPVGILQPPFYHKHFPKSLNYGGIGIVIGHEITHGFDDRGRLFDEHGNLDRWWDEGAIEKFHQKAKCLIDQYSSYTIRDIDIQINGVHTQGENIADNGGIKQAFKAYERWLSQNDASNENLPGLNATNFQLFFLNFAQVWCGGMRPEASKSKLKTAVHSPGKFRVIGTLSNSEEFALAFNCSTNSTMNLAKKCKVW
ncbi:hypothetical protein RUM44_012054 [Polyplax serrata]|uniref:Uncharacterized protein n=1 Tax=Polyplax serrata TaxID=468196 RepID=A0ABR1BA75_POLSC